METIVSSTLRTKQCPFCAETIQAQAIKCRFCGEFLNTDKARALEKNPGPSSQSSGDGKQLERILFAGRPSLFGMVGTVIRGLIFLGVAGFLVYYPLENLPMFRPDETLVSAEYTEPLEGLSESEPELAEDLTEEVSGFGLTERQSLAFGRYRVMAAAGLAAVVVLILLLKIIKLKMVYYEVTADRIEWSRGIFDRRVDNLDMFRVVDLKMRRSLLDCIFGIGTVGLVTTDKTDPEFTFEKIRNCRRLYYIIKKASLDADKRNSIIHLE